jgi:hypothetical protein
MEKVSQNIRITSPVILKKFPTVNNRPIGKNPPNLVTLVSEQVFSLRRRVLPTPPKTIINDQDIHSYDA